MGIASDIKGISGPGGSLLKHGIMNGVKLWKTKRCLCLDAEFAVNGALPVAAAVFINVI